MPRRKRSQNRPAKAKSPEPSRSGRRIVILTAAVLLLFALLWFGRTGLAWWTRTMAQARIHDGAISTAQGWLDWSAWLDPRQGATDVLRASCYRRLQQSDRWQAALAQAEQKGAPATWVRQEARLGRIESGRLDGGVEQEMTAMSEEGVPAEEACAALVNGCLVNKAPAWAKLVLDAWEAQHPEPAPFAYARGVYWLWMSDVERNRLRRRELTERAQRDFETALAKQPRHELARAALAGLLEDQSRLDEAVALAADAPAGEAAALNLARLLRAAGRLAEARRVLEPLARQPQASGGLAAQMAELELESGRYQEADRWFARAALDRPEGASSVVTAACSSALQEHSTRAQQLIARFDASHNRQVRMQDLADHLAVAADDPLAQDELRRLTAALPSPSELDAAPAANERKADATASTAGDLYALHCSGCHGQNGDGYGPATRHLFPKPRDLRNEKARLASTVNGVASLADIEAVLRRGMPGTAMRAFDNLSADQRMLLAQEVQRLNRLGFREHVIATFEKTGEEPDESEVREVVERNTTPGDPVRVPRIGPADPQAIARGKDVYVKLGCHTCHGPDGTGPGDLPQFDEKGRPAPARDLVHEAFKGGAEPESLYLRLLLGMPGTPHPACPGVAEDQLIDLVQYCRSLAREPKREWSNHQRALQAWTWGVTGEPVAMVPERATSQSRP